MMERPIDESRYPWPEWAVNALFLIGSVILGVAALLTR